jgi:putative transposase
VGSCRRDLLEHVIILNERHLKRLMSSYLLYITRTGRILDSRRTRQQVGLQKFTLEGESKIQSFPRLGGLHHRYAVAA